MPAALLTERRGATLVLTLADAAQRNRLSAQLVAAGIEALNVAESDPALRCIVLHGAGADFCAGMQDAPAVGAAPAEVAAAQWQAFDSLAQWAEALRAFSGPVIAAVEGRVSGAGLALLLASDWVIAATDARFEVAAEDRGADAAACALFADTLPRSLALQWLWQADGSGLVQRLLASGAIHRVSPSGRCLAEASALAERLAALPDGLLAEAKAQVDAAPTRIPLARQFALARDRLAADAARKP